MNRKIAKTLSGLLLLTAVAVTQVPVSDVEAVASASDFQMDGTKLMKYAGTAEIVSVPDGIKEIAEEAFAGNDNLVKVTVGADVESIGYRAFAGCDSLRTITIEGDVEEIGTAAFSNNKELVNVTLGDQVRTLGNGVFAGCSQLTHVTVGEGNPYLLYMDGVLYDDEQTKVYALMPAYEKGAYTLPATVTEISGYAFWGNPYLEKVTLGSGLYEVPAYAFSNCMNLKEVVIPLTVRGIGAKAFEDCVNLAQVTLPDSMTKISDTAFDGCPNVEFTATPGSYGAEFAASLKKAEVDEVEYEDVQNAEVIGADAVTGTEETVTPDPTQTPEGAETVPGGEPTPSPERPSLTDAVSNKSILGQSSIVSGRAVIFIDNRQPNVLEGNQSGRGVDLANMAEENSGSGANANAGETETIGSLLADQAQKGKDFPKFTVVGNSRIASQAFYQDSSLTEYTIEEGITEIGEFAFARSGLTSLEIPEGVTRIGYGAFYHCDQLSSVTIPDTVTEIELYAFDKTPWVTEMKTATYPYLIAGDGILIAYAGSDNVINIPDGVKQIGPGVFKDHMGITAVNIPDSVQVIGEEAFMNCQNLKTVNGGENLVKVKDRAFMNCPLSSVVIPETMEEIGLGAYAFSNGTDTAVFEGTKLPKLSMEKSAMRLANSGYRTYALGSIKNVIVPEGTDSLEGSVLKQGIYGTTGVIQTPAGAQLSDNRAGVSGEVQTGVTLKVISESLSEGENGMASIPGENGAYLLKITDSEKAGEKITAAYGELYGGRSPSGLKAVDMTLYDETGTVPITKLGKQYLNVQFKVPAGMNVDSIHVVTLDQDGQLEAVEYRTVSLEDGVYLQLTMNHFSPVGIYEYAELSGQASVINGKAVITSLSGKKDSTPDTGDLLHPKWFLALGLLAGAVALFFYRGKPGRKTKTN